MSIEEKVQVCADQGRVGKRKPGIPGVWLLSMVVLFAFLFLLFMEFYGFTGERKQENKKTKKPLIFLAV